MHVPVRVAAATTSFTIGLTAATGLVVMTVQGRLDLHECAAVTVGSMLGGRVGALLQPRLSPPQVRRFLDRGTHRHRRDPAGARMNRPRIDHMPGHLGDMLTAATIVAFLATVIGTVMSNDLGHVAGGVAVAAIIAAPLLRVAILGVHWWRQHDRRFALTAAALLAVTAVGAALAMLQ